MRTPIRAEVVGSVSNQHCDTGAQVKAGESIGEVECMKTMFSILAPCDGVLRWIADVGAFVGEGEIIAEIE